MSNTASARTRNIDGEILDRVWSRRRSRELLAAAVMSSTLSPAWVHAKAMLIRAPSTASSPASKGTPLPVGFDSHRSMAVQLHHASSAN